LPPSGLQSCRISNAQTTSEGDKAEVTALNQRLMEAFNKKDVPSIWIRHALLAVEGPSTWQSGSGGQSFVPMLQTTDLRNVGKVATDDTDYDSITWLALGAAEDVKISRRSLSEIGG
jgi:hypothetical protein